VLLYEVALSIVLVEVGQEGSELDSVVTISDVFEDHMPSILLENVQCQDQDEEIAYF
jgi:hypothetical protein